MGGGGRGRRGGGSLDELRTGRVELGVGMEEGEDGGGEGVIWVNYRLVGGPWGQCQAGGILEVE